MTRMWWLAIVVSMVGMLGGAPPVMAAARVGEAAPDFSLTDAAGQTRSLSEFRDRWVVLEWVNPDCPFVRKHYDSRNMQDLQQAYTTKDVVWLSINSSAPGKQGHLTPELGQQFLDERGARPTALLLDADGRVGRLYGAKTTPHIFIVNPDGVLVYMGAIDDRRSVDPTDAATAHNYVRATLDAGMGDQPIAVSATEPYGCSVKY